MGYELKVDTGDVQTKATKIQTESAEIEARLGQLTTAMADLASTWTGSAAAAFQELFGDWGKTAKQMKDALEGIGKSLNSAGQNYDELEGKLAQQFK